MSWSVVRYKAIKAPGTLSTIPYDPVARTVMLPNELSNRLLNAERMKVLIWIVIPKEAAQLSSDISAKNEVFQLNENEK